MATFTTAENEIIILANDYIRKLNDAGWTSITRKSVFENLAFSGNVKQKDKEGKKLTVAIMERVAYMNGGIYDNRVNKNGDARIVIGSELDERPLEL